MIRVTVLLDLAGNQLEMPEKYYSRDAIEYLGNWSCEHYKEKLYDCQSKCEAVGGLYTCDPELQNEFVRLVCSSPELIYENRVLSPEDHFNEKKPLVRWFRRLDHTLYEAFQRFLEKPTEKDAEIVLAHPTLNKRKFIVKTIVEKCARAIRWASLALREDREIVLKAVRQDSSAIRWASKSLRTDKKFMQEIEAMLENRRTLGTDNASPNREQAATPRSLRLA